MIDIVVPEEQEGTKAVVRSWLKRVGDPIAKDDPVVELETDKVTQEVPSPASGVLSEIILDTDAEAVPGALLGRIAQPDDVPAEVTESVFPERIEGLTRARPTEAEVFGNGETETRLSPSVRRALQQHGIDPARIRGTGRDGRITREDVDRCVAEAMVVSVGETATAQPRRRCPRAV